MAQLVRRLLWEQEIAGSSPAVPTSKRPPYGGRFSFSPALPNGEAQVLDGSVSVVDTAHAMSRAHLWLSELLPL